MKFSKPRLIKIAVIVVIAAVIVTGASYLFFFRWPCGGVMGLSCPKSYICKYKSETENSNIVIADKIGVCVPEKKDEGKNNQEEPVPYDDSFGAVCPPEKKFIKSASLDVRCNCPTDYTFKSDIIGYEQCAGPGSECPILSIECILETNK